MHQIHEAQWLESLEVNFMAVVSTNRNSMQLQQYYQLWPSNEQLVTCISMQTCKLPKRKLAFHIWKNDIYQTFWLLTSDLKPITICTVFQDLKNLTQVSQRQKKVVDTAISYEVAKEALRRWSSMMRCQHQKSMICLRPPLTQVQGLLLLSMVKIWSTGLRKLCKLIIPVCKGL